MRRVRSPVRDVAYKRVYSIINVRAMGIENSERDVYQVIMLTIFP